MQALQLIGWQRDAEFRDVPVPAAGPGQVVIRVGGSGACHSDLHVMHEFPPGLLPYELPFTLGHEPAGSIHELGEGVEGFAVGDAVAVYGPWRCGHCDRCRVGMENHCENVFAISAGLGRDGGMAEYMLVPETRWLVPLGDLDPADAAPLTDAALTPYSAIKPSLPLLVPGSTVVVIGVGGLGHMAVQVLRAMSPATVIAIDRRKQALELAQEVGAHETVVANDGVADAVQRLAPRGAELVVDCVASDSTLAMGAAMTRTLGHLVVVGMAGGTLPVGQFSVPSGISVRTSNWGSLPELHEVVALARAGLLRPKVVRFPLDEAMTAYRALEAGDIDGRAVIVP